LAAAAIMQLFADEFSENEGRGKTIVFRPKRYASDVSLELAKGFLDGSIVLEHHESNSAASRACWNIFLRPVGSAFRKIEVICF
jgi:hypothetical protein